MNVKALESMPFLCDVDEFYWKMYSLCGNDIGNITNYCRLYEFDTDEILESIELLSAITSEVNNASSKP